MIFPDLPYFYAVYPMRGCVARVGVKEGPRWSAEPLFSGPRCLPHPAALQLLPSAASLTTETTECEIYSKYLDPKT